MAETLISTRVLKVISNRSAGNGRSPGKPPFPDFQGHFHGHEGRPGRLNVANPHSLPPGVSGASTIAGLADRVHAGKLEDTASLPRTGKALTPDEAPIMIRTANAVRMRALA